MVTAAFIGSGFMGQVHTRAARAAGADLKYVVASTPERSQQAAANLGVQSGADLQRVLDDPQVDVVHVLTPNATHADITRQVIMAGKHVVCEKPLATSVADAAALTELAQAAGIVATVPFVYRFHPMVREARARVQAGELGRLFTVQGMYLQDWLLGQSDNNWRVAADQGGDSRAFGDVGSHLFDLVQFISGEAVTAVSTATSTVFAARDEVAVDTEDAVSLIFQSEGGAIGSALVSQVAPGRKNALTVELHGANESLRFEQENPETLWVGKRTHAEIHQRDQSTLSNTAQPYAIVPAGHAQGYQDAFNVFVADTYAAIEGAEVDGLPRFDDGLRMVRLTEAVMASAKEKTWRHL